MARTDGLESFGRDYVRRVRAGQGRIAVAPDVATSDEGRALKFMVC